MKWGVVLGVMLLSPLYALAAGTSFFGPIVPACTEYGGAVPICQACNLIQLGDNLLRFFVSLAVMIAALMFAYAGYMYVSASSNKQNIDTAKKIFTNVFIGLVFVLAAYLTLERDALKARITERLDARLALGMLDEARKLHAAGLSYERMEELGLEYRYMARHLQGQISFEEMRTVLVSEIYKYAKRQKTWFKRNMDITWYDPRTLPSIGTLVRPS